MMKRLVSLIVPVSAIGSAGLAALATACCVGPTIVALLGVSGAVAAASVIPYRSYLLGLSAALVAFAVWHAYRPRAACSTNQCTTQRTARVVVWIAAAATAVSAAIPLLLEYGGRL
jgi:mercuric ion transport protein